MLSVAMFIGSVESKMCDKLFENCFSFVFQSSYYYLVERNRYTDESRCALSTWRNRSRLWWISYACLDNEVRILFVLFLIFFMENIGIIVVRCMRLDCVHKVDWVSMRIKSRN